jgi:hypothetical protein
MAFSCPITENRFRRGAERLHRLGPKAITEFLVEIAAAIGGEPAISRKLTEFEFRAAGARRSRASHVRRGAVR